MNIYERDVINAAIKFAEMHYLDKEQNEETKELIEAANKLLEFERY